MKIAVYPHSMEIGGSQLNAVEIGAEVARHGHDVVLVAEPGPMQRHAERLGLEQVMIPLHRRRPSVPVARILNDLVSRRSLDIVHGYEWPPVMDAWLGPGLRSGTAVTATVMSGEVAPFLPHRLPLLVGTAELRDRCLESGRARVRLLEPPVDTRANHPSHPTGAFRSDLGIGVDTTLLVVVCRLARELKLEGLLSACRVVSTLALSGEDIALVIVGDGPAREAVASGVRSANAPLGRQVVHLPGQMDDPRPAYAAADLMLGMGGSALRGLAFGKPLIVQGELGFWRRCDEETVDQFLRGGWYGLGDGSVGDTRLREQLAPLLADRALRTRLGQMGRRLIVDRFSLEHAARAQIDAYEEALTVARRPTVRELGRALSLLVPYKLDRRRLRRRGLASADDFNTLPEAARRG